MAHEIETMAYANKTPWHGLGNRVDPNVSIEEMLIASGLNWTVSKRPLYAYASDLENGERVSIPNAQAIMRDSDKKIMSISSDRWTPVQNSQMMEFFRDYTASGGAKLETAGSLSGGQTVWALANLGEGFTIGSRDRVNGYLLFSSSHKVGVATKVRVVATRVVCANTLALAMSEQGKGNYTQNHCGAFNEKAAKANIEAAHEQIAAFGLDAQRLSKIKISRQHAVEILASHVQPTENETKFASLLSDETNWNPRLKGLMASLNNAPGAEPDTAWGLLNAVTYWADHIACRTQDVRLISAWSGKNAAFKLKIKEELLQAA